MASVTAAEITLDKTKANRTAVMNDAGKKAIREGGEGQSPTRQVGADTATGAMANGGFDLEVTDTAVADITGLAKQEMSGAAIWGPGLARTTRCRRAR